MVMSGGKQTVAIYGGGIGGGLLAKRLMADFDVTLVDPLDYFEVPMSAPRSLVFPDFANAATFAFAEALPGVTHIGARLEEWTEKGGIVRHDVAATSVVHADISVLATGSTYANPLMRAFNGTMAERKAFYRRFHERLTGSRHILIVGGGPIGVEVAGEISETFPHKQLTLIEAGPRILGGTSAKAAAHAARVLAKRGVTILTGEKLLDGMPADDIWAPGGEVRTTAGRTIAHDLVIWCVGGRPNTGYMRQQFANLLDANGRIRVDPNLRVRGESRLFALGDITDLDENKMAWHVGGQVEVAEANIRAVAAGQAPAKSYRPRTGDPRMAITLGSRAGVVHMPGLGVVRAGWLVRAAKAAHMLVPRYRKEFDLSKEKVLSPPG